MSAWLVILAIIVLVVLVAIGFFVSRARRSAGLRNRFGPEYERRINEIGDRTSGEAELREVSSRRDRLDIRTLGNDEREGYSERWKRVQSNFVDRPDQAVMEADILVAEVMQQRGYPVENFDEQFDMVAADYPSVSSNYRAAHLIFERNSQGLATTDDLRQALIHYRGLFDELLEESSVRK